jgi:hypothetical protein
VRRRAAAAASPDYLDLFCRATSSCSAASGSGGRASGAFHDALALFSDERLGSSGARRARTSSAPSAEMLEEAPLRVVSPLSRPAARSGERRDAHRPGG